MYEQATSKLRGSIEELEQMLERTRHEIYLPILLVQPPGAREAHDAQLATQAAILGSFLGTVSALTERILAVRKGLFLLEQSCQAARTSISALPEEVLRNILELSRPIEGAQNQYEEEKSVHDLMVFRYNVSLVCRKWASVLATQRSLWDSIHLPSDRISQITPFVGKAPNDPLFLILTPSIPHSLDPPASQMLLGRLGSLAIHCDDPSFLGFMRPFGQVHSAPGLVFQVLESLSINYTWDGHSDSTLQPIPPFISFPSLKFLAFDGIVPMGAINAPVLQHLSLGGQHRLELDHLFNMFLEGCPNLNALELDAFVAWDFLRPTTLSSVFTLTLSRVSKRYLARIGGFLRLPNLHTLSILGWTEPEYEDQNVADSDAWHLLQRDDVPEGVVDDISSMMLAVRTMFRFMPNLAKIIVEANQTLTYAVLAPILPIPNMLPLARSLHTVDIRFVGNCDEVGQLRALAGFIRDIVLGRHAIDSAIQVTLPICLQNKLEVGRLPPNSVTGWHEECKCGRCYM